MIDQGGVRTAIEIKLTTSPSPSDLNRLNKVADMIQASRRMLISRTTESIKSDRVISCDLATALGELA